MSFDFVAPNARVPRPAQLRHDHLAMGGGATTALPGGRKQGQGASVIGVGHTECSQDAWHRCVCGPEGSSSQRARKCSWQGPFRVLGRR